VLTFNIQQGYRADGQKGWGDQLALMRQVNADIIGLQESDTARLSGANNDLVGYFATALGMHAYYGPPTVNGTFGIALLSRYPILEARTAYMESQGEQTAIILATVSVNGQALHVAVTHLGNGGPMVQEEDVLQAIRGLSPLVLMGDFNFTPNTPQYRRTVEALQDAWLVARAHGGATHLVPPAPIDHTAE
jgi:endonuclease/exonuclease/phosphatase family metal-dependent hydrolase